MTINLQASLATKIVKMLINPYYNCIYGRVNRTLFVIQYKGEWKFMWNPKIIDTDKVLYIAIADAIERDIRLGILKQNEKMPPQRSLAKTIGVNLTTITRAYKEAEKRGLITGTIGRGTYVSDDKKDRILPEILGSEDEIIELGLVGSIKIEGYDLSKQLKAVAKGHVLDSLLDYVPSQGIRRHREVAAGWIKQYGLNADCEHIVICAGAMHAINCCLLGLFDPGDRIAVDMLTFTGFKNAAQLNRMKLEPIVMDSEGMVPEHLEEQCKKHQIKGIYLMPNLQNPTATEMSKKRKREIADIILKYGLILIEDDIYNFMNVTNKTALSTLVPDNGVYICSISKSLFPGLRIAFASVPQRFLYKFNQAVTNTVWMAPTISSELVTQFIESGTAAEMINQKKLVIENRIQLAKTVLRDYSFQAIEGSPFLWLNLPEGWNCAEFENTALMNHVRVISAYKFYVGTQLPPNAVRVSLGSVENDEQMQKGLHILLRILKQYPILASSFLI
ncbi:PLP-dependent aminotransferase family protein [Sinanaerobacter chloroacetimidivorans]|nr:PLP-dependent aminotransferase family protein [Sinanaerobacter chloroacetimidivorans]